MRTAVRNVIPAYGKIELLQGRHFIAHRIDSLPEVVESAE
jgi:hypothetical protein